MTDSRRELLDADASDQQKIDDLQRQLEILEAEHRQLEHSALQPDEIVRRESEIEAERLRVRRTIELYQKQARGRLQSVHQAFADETEKHRLAELDERNTRSELADQLLQENAEIISKVADIFLSWVSLKDRAPRQLSELVQDIFGRDHFDYSDMAEAVARLGIEREGASKSQELIDAEFILERELGGGWQHQRSDWLRQQLDPDAIQAGEEFDHDGVPIHRGGVVAESANP